MTPELVAILAVGVALAGLLLAGQRATRADIAELRAGLAELRERMARLEGLFDGFTKSRQDSAAE